MRALYLSRYAIALRIDVVVAERIGTAHETLARVAPANAAALGPAQCPSGGGSARRWSTGTQSSDTFARLTTSAYFADSDAMNALNRSRVVGNGS